MSKVISLVLNYTFSPEVLIKPFLILGGSFQAQARWGALVRPARRAAGRRPGPPARPIDRKGFGALPISRAADGVRGDVVEGRSARGMAQAPSFGCRHLRAQALHSIPYRNRCRAWQNSNLKPRRANGGAFYVLPRKSLRGSYSVTRAALSPLPPFSR